MNETLGERMKRYEHEHRTQIDQNDILMMRLDGKAFHSYTKGLKRPYDAKLMKAMDTTMLALCNQIQGVRLGYTQSDEISLMITRGPDKAEMWMGGVTAKILSLSAAIASVEFNDKRQNQHESSKKRALFDSRVWTLPNTEEGRIEAENYFLWRQRDCIKNSVTMAASVHFSHRELDGVNTSERVQKLEEIRHAWSELPKGFKRGRVCYRQERTETVQWVHGKTGETHSEEVTRRPFVVTPAGDMSELSIDNFIV